MVGQQRFATRSCFRFGIYSESLDRNKPRLITSKKLKFGISAAMITIGSLMVGLIAYDMTSAYATPKRGKDAVTHLVKLRTTSTTTTSTASTVHPPSTTLPTTTLPHTDKATTTQQSYEEVWTAPAEIDEDVLTSALPLLKPFLRSARAKKVQEPYQFEVPLPPSTSNEDYREKAPTQRRVMHGVDTSPRPFRTRSNHTLERINRINAYKNNQQALLPYYSFTAPHRYPQLTSYRYPSDANNIQDIIKYLTEDNDKPATSPKGHYLDAGVFRVPSGTATKAIKFAGVYKSAKVDNNRYQETKDDFRVSNQNSAGTSSLLNGHAYIADPFHAYKPTNPAEVNQLASNTDFRHRHHSDRYQYSNGANGRGNTFEVNSNNKYFPRPPINFGRPSASQSESNEHIQPAHYPNSHTSVIYRPLGSETSSTSFPPYTADNNYPKNNMKPISVLLDIYPMMEGVSVHTSSPTNLRPRPAQGFGTKPKFPHAEHQNSHHEDNDGKHQMVVHLNLYPRKKKKNNGFSNRSDNENSSDDLDYNQHCDKETKNNEELEEEEESEVEYVSKLNKGDSEILWRFSKVAQEDNEETWNEPLPSAAELTAVESVIETSATTMDPVQL